MFELVDPALTTYVPTVRDAFERPDRTAAALTVLEPGADTVEPLLSLLAGRLSDGGLVDALVACERHLAALHAAQQAFLAEAARRDPDGETFLRDEVACALKVAPGTARGRMDTAVELTGRLWDTYELVRAGRLSAMHARILAEAVAMLDDDVAAKVQAAVLPRGEAHTPGEFRAAVRRAVARFDNRKQEERHLVAFADRRVVHMPAEDGMAEIWMRLAADGAAAFMTAVDAVAAAGTCPDGPDRRTADQRRADAAVQLAIAALGDPALPTAHGMRPAVSITVAATTLLGLDEQPAELDGYGPIPAGMATRIAADPSGTWRRMLTDPAGRLLDCGSTTYKPPTRIARHVVARDQHCVHPGCRRRARACELDHRVPYPMGPTSADNLQPLCKRHHLVKHRGGWSVAKDRRGGYRWTSPTNHAYVYRPPALPAPVGAARGRRRPPLEHAPPPF